MSNSLDPDQARHLSGLIWVQTVCKVYLVNFHAFLLSAEFFQNQIFLKNSFRNIIRVSNSLDPDQAQCFVGPDLCPNCLQRLSVDA